MGFTEEDAKSRLRLVLGEEGLEKLDSARVVVAGIGGVGSNCAEALVRGGVGHLAFIDADRVEPSNINRQAIAFYETIGCTKVSVMRDMALEINPGVRTVESCEFLTAETIPAVMDDIIGELGGCDYLVDAIDTVTAKIALAHYAQERGIAIISSMGGANKMDPTRFTFADLFETSVDPLCRAMRKLARNAGIVRLDVLYSTEPPVEVHGGGLGTMSYIPPIMGQMIAGFVIRKLLQS